MIRHFFCPHNDDVRYLADNDLIYTGNGTFANHLRTCLLSSYIKYFFVHVSLHDFI